MKKIFAIALALVMVLSMASAFASPCTAGFDWTNASASNCGKAKIEVVPYVKVSNGCGGFTWQVSECAGSVKGENVYYAVKLTVDANPDAEWWAQASLPIKTTGFTAATSIDENLSKLGVDLTATSEAVYYYNWRTGWQKVSATGISVADDVEAEVSAYITKAEVADSSKAKVCVKVVSKYDFEEGVVGEYYVVYTAAKGAVAAKKATLTAKEGNAIDLSKVVVTNAAGNQALTGWTVEYADGKVVATAPEAGALGFVPRLYYTNGSWVEYDADFAEGSLVADAAYATLEVFDKKGDAAPLATYYIGANDKVVAVDYSNAGSCAPNDMASIKAYFGIVEGTAITTKLLNKNFGWDDKAEDCFKWNATSAIVDANCVVAIPKTGDASVLAWLF